VAPLLAVSFALFTHFPVFGRFETALERHLLKGMLPEGIAPTVLRALQQFASNAGSLTLVSSLVLVGAALALLLTVENALNQIWNVKRSRPLAKRVGVYLLMLALLPPALGISLWATSTLLGASMGLIETLPPSARFVLDLGPVALGWVALTCLFRYVPNTQVPSVNALVGGLIASVGIEICKRAFAAWLVKLPTYKALYGAFAAFPVFGLWIYVSWLVTLAAALIAANLGRSAR
jgi:membrane protein